MEYKTLSRSDSEFESYLLGTFSKNQRAIPTQTLNVNSPNETVTFRIVDIEDIRYPGKLEFFLKAFRVHHLLMVIFPLLLVLSKNTTDRVLADSGSVLLSTLGIVFAFIAAGFRNDYMDHVRGMDRICPEAGSRVIQLGWLTASEARKYAYFFLGLSLICAIPLVYSIPALGIVVALSLLVGLWAQFTQKNSFKYQIGGEVSIFFLLGPLLTTGYQMALGSGFDIEVMLIGALWGWMVLFLIHLKNFGQIMALSQAGFQNTITWLGFDRSRRMLGIWWFLFIIFYFIYHCRFGGFYWGWYMSLALLFLSTRFFLNVRTIASPVGSDLGRIQEIGRRLYLLVVGIWAFENIWYIFSNK